MLAVGEERGWVMQGANTGATRDLLSAVLNADPHALFVVEPSLKIRCANRGGWRLRQKRILFRFEGDRLAGRTNRVDYQLAQAMAALLRAPDDAAPPVFPAVDKPQFTFELLKLDVPEDPLVLIRVYEGFAGPEATGRTGLELTLGRVNVVHRRHSADGLHGPVDVKRRASLPPLSVLSGFEAYARLGSMAAAAVELATFPATIGRSALKLEALTKRRLLKGFRHTRRLTSEGRQLARALTTAFDILDAAVRPLPEGRRRGRPPRDGQPEPGASEDHKTPLWGKASQAAGSDEAPAGEDPPKGEPAA